MFYFPQKLYGIILPIDDLIFFNMVETTVNFRLRNADLSKRRRLHSDVLRGPAGHVGRVPVPFVPW